jgi:molecular chaperone GrpE
MVRDEMLATFDRFSLKPVETKVGAELDPAFEEALGILPVPGIPENRIAVVVRKGYTLHGKVLRAAQVMVGAGTPAATAEAAPEDAPAEDGGAGKEE